MVNCTTMMVGMLLMPAGRPNSIGFVEDPQTGARCHWNRANDEALCEEILVYIQDSWRTQVDEEGWPEPFSDGGAGGSDGLDFYLDTSAEWGAYTDSSYADKDESDGRMGAEAYVVIDPRITEEMNLFVAHEFNHVLQYATDMSEPALPPWEAAATVAEEVTYPGEGSWKSVAPDFNNTPWESLLGDGYHLWDDHEIWSFYEYGTSVWLEHLQANYDVAAVDLWWAMTNPTWQNEPDVWDAYDAVTGDATRALVSLSIERARMGRSDAPDWAAGADAPVSTQGTLANLDEWVTPEFKPQDLGVVYFDVTASGRQGFEIDGSDETRWRLIDVETGNVWGGMDVGVVEGPGLVGVVNIGPAGLETDDICDWSNGCRFPGRDVSVRLVELPEDETGLIDSGVDDTGEPMDTGGDGEDGDCGCSSGAGGGLPMGLWGLAGLALWRRRRC